MGQKDLLYCLKIEKVSQGIFHLLIICNSIFITQKIMLLVINQLYLLRNILVYTQNKRKKQVSLVGLHVCITRTRSPVRSRQETELFFVSLMSIESFNSAVVFDY